MESSKPRYIDLPANGDLRSQGRDQSVGQVPSRATGIGDASVIKDGGVYFLCRPDGSIPLSHEHGLGLYWRDCRFLSGYEVQLGGHALESLMANAEDAFRAIFLLTNATDARGVGRRRIGVRWRHVADGRHCALADELVLENYDTQTHSLELSLRFVADFRDVFIVRGLVDQPPAKRCRPRWSASALVFSYDGEEADGFEHRLRIVRPVLPSFVDRLVLEGLRVGRARVDLLFERIPEGALAVGVQRLDGQLHVQVDNDVR